MTEEYTEIFQRSRQYEAPRCQGSVASDARYRGERERNQEARGLGLPAPLVLPTTKARHGHTPTLTTAKGLPHSKPGRHPLSGPWGSAPGEAMAAAWALPPSCAPAAARLGQRRPNPRLGSHSQGAVRTRGQEASPSRGRSG